MDIVEKCVGVWGEMWKEVQYASRCRKVCWGVGEVREDAGTEVREEMLGRVRRSVLGPHTPTHFPTPLPFLYPPANTLPHSPHTLSHTSPLPTHLSLPPPTPHHTSPYIPHTSFHSSLHLPLVYTLTHFPTHPMHSPTPLPAALIMWQSCHVTMLP